jgi:spermidine synthase
VHALHLGGGALTLPRYLAHTRPGSRQLVAEVDDALTDLVREHLPLPPGTASGCGPRTPARCRVGPAGQL